MLPVEVRGPVDEVESTEKDREHYPRHLVDLTHAVVRLLRIHHFGFGRTQLHGRHVGYCGDGHVFCQIWSVVDARRADIVGFLRQHHGIPFLRQIT